MTKTTARTENTKQRIIVTILLCCFAVILYFVFLNEIHNRISIETSRREMKETAQYLQKAYKGVKNATSYAQNANEEIYQQDVAVLCYLAAKDPDFEISDRYLGGMDKLIMSGSVMISDTKGQILASSDGEHPKLSDEICGLVKKAFETGTVVDQTQLIEYSGVKGLELETEEEEESENTAQLTEMWVVEAIDEEHAFVLKIIDWMEIAGLQKQDEWKRLLENRTIGEEGFAFVWLDETNEVLYYPEAGADHLTTETLGLDVSQIRDDAYDWYQVNGRKVYLYTVHDKEEGVWIACADPLKSLEDLRKFTVTVFCIVFDLFIVDLAYYIILLLKQKKVKVFHDFTGAERKNDKKGKKHKLLILTCVLSVLLFLFQFYLQTLYLMSNWSGFASRQTAWIEQKAKDQETLATVYTKCYEEEKKQQLSLLAWFLSVQPELCTAETLDVFSYLVSAGNILILDPRGSVEVSTSSMSYASMLKPEDTGEAGEGINFSEVVATQDSGKSVYDWMSEGRKVILPMNSDEQSDPTYLYVFYYSAPVEHFLHSLSLDDTLDMVQPGNGGFVFAVDKETREFAYYPNKELQGKDALQYGLTKNQIRDNYSDYITIDGTSYYTVTDELGSNLVYYSISRSRLLAQRTQLCILATALAVLLFFLTGLAIYTSREQVELVQPEEERHAIVEDHNSPENRALRVMGYYLIAAAGIIAVYSFFRANSGTGGVIGYVLDGKWERGFNVFALFASAIIMSEGGIILFLFSRIVQAVGGILPVREGTILKMLGSLMTYVAIAFLIYQCMVCFGLNPTALMASAGIVSVVLGIGANSLVGDILAGIFLLMEGNVQVGDVVQIGDFRGYVIDMGIRMTKLFDMDMDDVKIIPNNEVRNVVHMTMHVSIVYSDFQIRYEEKLENVEKILREELKNVKDKSPLILEGPIYIGVMALDANGVVLRTKTKCHEPCRRKVEREVNHIVYSIFQKNQISVPYPQVTLHEGDDKMVER